MRIQGVHLAEAGLHREAIELFERVLAEYPAPLEIAPALSSLAKTFLALGDHDRALDAMRRALIREREYPNVTTDAALEFAFTASRLGASELFEEARDVLRTVDVDQSVMPFPVQKFKFHAARALLSESRDHASEEAAAALVEAGRTTSGLRYHRKLGLARSDFKALRARLHAIVGG